MSTIKQMSEMSKEEVNRELCERLGIQWHCQTEARFFTCSCEEYCFSLVQLAMHIDKHNPNFFSDSGKVMLLREMMKRQAPSRTDWYEFVQEVLEAPTAKSIWYGEFDYDFLTEEGNGLLAKTTLKFLRREEGGSGNG